MGQHSEAVERVVAEANVQIPDKITSGHGLDQAEGASVSKHAFLPSVHMGAFEIMHLDPYGGQDDDGGLDEGDGMDMPVEFGALVELGVGFGEEEIGDEGRNIEKTKVVEESGRDDLMGMGWQRLEVELCGDGLRRRLQPRRVAQREGIEHGGGERGGERKEGRRVVVVGVEGEMENGAVTAENGQVRRLRSIPPYTRPEN